MPKEMELVRLRPTTLHSKEPTCFIHVDDEKAPSRSTLRVGALQGATRLATGRGQARRRGGSPRSLEREARVPAPVARRRGRTCPFCSPQGVGTRGNTAGPIVQHCQCCQCCTTSDRIWQHCRSDRAFGRAARPPAPFQNATSTVRAVTPLPCGFGICRIDCVL